MALFVAAPASACSVAQGYRIPSNFEMVHDADLIVLARVVAGPDRQVELVPVQVLKGRYDGRRLVLPGVVAWRGRPTILPSPTPLRAPHFSVWSGGCIRALYSEGSLVVAMFALTPEGMFQVGGAFSRSVEDVEGADGLWVRTVSEYLAAQQGVTGATLRSAGERLRIRMAERRGNLAAEAMADDLRAWLDDTAPGGAAPRDGPAWGWTSDTEGAGVELGDATLQRAVVLRCARGGSALQVILEESEGVPQLALEIGSRRFNVEGEARQPQLVGPPRLTGHVAFTPILAALMRSSTAPAGIAVDGRILLTAPPADMLQKLAIGCALMLRPGRAGGPVR